MFFKSPPAETCQPCCSAKFPPSLFTRRRTSVILSTVIFRIPLPLTGALLTGALTPLMMSSRRWLVVVSGRAGGVVLIHCRWLAAASLLFVCLRVVTTIIVCRRTSTASRRLAATATPRATSTTPMAVTATTTAVMSSTWSAATTTPTTWPVTATTTRSWTWPRPWMWPTQTKSHTYGVVVYEQSVLCCCPNYLELAARWPLESRVFRKHF